MMPDRFTLVCEPKPDGWWKVTSPEIPGLYFAGRDLAVLLEDVPRSIALLCELDGKECVA